MRTGQSLYIYKRIVFSHIPETSKKAGGIFVDRAAEALLQRKFINSNFGTEEFIKEMLTIFETQVGSSSNVFSKFEPQFSKFRRNEFSMIRKTPSQSRSEGAEITTRQME